MSSERSAEAERSSERGDSSSKLQIELNELILEERPRSESRKASENLPELTIVGLEKEQRQESKPEQKLEPKPESPTSDPEKEFHNQKKDKPGQDSQKQDPAKNQEKKPDLQGDKLKPSAQEPVITTSVDHAGKKVVIKTWNSGPQKGEREESFENGSKLHYKPDGKGGILTTHTRADGNTSESHAYPDGKGNVILENVDSKDNMSNYRAVYGKDGSLVVDYGDGRHLERKAAGDGTVHVTMTGPNASDNFTATEKDGVTKVDYTDGSGYTYKGGKFEVHGKYGGVFDKILPLASDGRLATFWALNGAFWMSLNASVAEVRRMNGSKAS